MAKGKKSGTRRQQRKVGKVMREYYAHKLHSGSRRGPTVRSRKQAIAIAMSVIPYSYYMLIFIQQEAGMSKRKRKSSGRK